MSDKNSVEEELQLRFEPMSSSIDPNFWFKVFQLKLEVDKLDEVLRPITGYYNSKKSPYMTFDCSSFNQEVNDETYKYFARGHCLNKNTIETFKNCDKNELLKQFGQQMLDDFRSGRAIEDPSLILAFYILMFSNLKKYQFFFWVAFPSLTEPKYYLTSAPISLKNIFSSTQFDLLVTCFQNLNKNQRGFFGVVTTTEADLDILTLKQYLDVIKVTNKFVGFLVFADPSDMLNNPGWPLRNMLYLLLLHCNPFIRTSVIKVIALRGSPLDKFSSSMVFYVKASSNIDNILKQDSIHFVGWEKNAKDMFGPKYVDLSNTMDSKKKAKESVDLNLKLMKWQISPHLNLDVIAQSKCLIIGAGTLGCCVARNLLSWGVRNITLVDNGKVSYSNPVRQSLYKFSHCINSNTYKALAAADELREIYPEVNSVGLTMNIPMIGHAANVEDYKNVDLLSKLIEDHDVVFLLTDSRESRWLPTMLCTLHNKLAITAALGFESYLVMRHGVQLQDVTSSKKKLACYFCNDVTAPGNSLKDRTLDQQCTVSRPGVSSIAGALAVELFVSYLQLKHNVSANAECCIGIVPHSIRGFIHDYQQFTPYSPIFPQCIACSQKVVDSFLNDKEQFLNNVFTNSSYLEHLTGITELREDFEKSMIIELYGNEDFENVEETESSCK